MTPKDVTSQGGPVWPVPGRFSTFVPMYELRTEDLDFLDNAPVVHVFEGDVSATPAEVFAAVCDVDAWRQWFPMFQGGAYEGEPGLGAVRRINLPMWRIEEHIVAWDEAKRFTYAVDRSSLPIANALVESWDLTDTGHGTRVRWTFAIDPRLPMKLVTPLAPTAMGALFRAGLKRMESYLSAKR